MTTINEALLGLSCLGGSLVGLLVGFHTGGVTAAATGFAVGLVPPATGLAVLRYGSRTLDRLTHHMLPNIDTRVHHLHTSINPLARDTFETSVQRTSTWTGDMIVTIDPSTTPPSCAVGCRQDRIPVTLPPTTHPLTTPLVQPPEHNTLQRFLWKRWLRQHLTWTHAEPAYSAHQRLHAHQRQHHLSSTPPSYRTDTHTTDRQHLVLS